MRFFCYDGLAETVPSIQVGSWNRDSWNGTYRAQRRYNDGQALLYFDQKPTREGATADEGWSDSKIVIRLDSDSHGFAGWCLAQAVNKHGMFPRHVNPMWYVPNSMGRPLPPENGWIPTDSNPWKGSSPNITYRK